MTLRVLSLGAGVQSTTVLLMSLAGELPSLDYAIFADTGAEPAAVYEHLATLEKVAAAGGVPVVRVSAGSLTSALLDASDRRGVQIPAFVEGAGLLSRQCTERFKSRPIYRYLDEIRDGTVVEVVMGISWDEVHRVRDPKRRWVTNAYPLVDRRLTRHDCQRWLSAQGWTAPRSACVYCPYHDNTEWRRLRDEAPADFAEAVRVDAMLREVQRDRVDRGTTSLTRRLYVHRSLVPLADVDLSTEEDHGQGSLWAGECEGLCGV